MLKVARTYKTNLAAICLSPGVRATLPTWYHPYAETRPITNVNTKCLLENHKVKTVADLVKLANNNLARTQNDAHLPALTCTCMGCVHDRLKGCRTPHLCALEAEARLNDIAPKYNLIAFEHHDTLSLTPDQKARNLLAKIEKKEIAFDPTITCKDGIVECFRIFTDPERISTLPASRRPQRGSYLDHVEMKVYIDGSCINIGKANAQCGSGVWIEKDHPLNMALRVPGPSQSNQVGELAAVIAAVETLQTTAN